MAISPRGRILTIFLALFVGLPLLILVAAHLTLALKPNLVRDRALAKARSACDCELDWKDWSISLLGGGVSFKDFRLSTGTEGDEVHSLTVRELDVRVKLTSLVGEEPELRAVALRGLDYEVREWETPPTRHAPTPDEPRGPPALIARALTIEDSRFVYRKVYKGKREATITVKDIALNASPVVVGRERTSAKLTGIVEESGKLELSVEGDLAKAKTPPVKIQLTLSKLRLSDANEYFRAADGIELKGELVKGEVEILLEERQLRGEVKVLYRGLDVKFLKQGERGGFGAFFQSLVADIALDKTNTDPLDRDFRANVAFRQQNTESVFRFILRGMREGAIEIAKSHREKPAPK